MKRRRKPSLVKSFDGHFPTEILTEVLTGLPVKTLLRFRCVSKTWCAIIDDPNFIFMHMSSYNEKNNHDKNYCHVSTLERTESGSLNFSIRRSHTYRRCGQLLNLREKFYPLPSVDGLILLENGYEENLILWNPSIRKSLIIPPPRPCWREDLFAVGFAPLSNTYKVVAFRGDEIRLCHRYTFMVYSLSDGFWQKHTRCMDVLNNAFHYLISHKCLSVKGAAYWLLSTSSNRIYTHVLSFNFDTEEFSFLELPGVEEKISRSLFRFGESLAVLGISRANASIWVMNKDGGKELWTKWYSGNLSSNEYTTINRRSPTTKLLYLKKTGVLLMPVGDELISYNGRSQVISYNIRSHEIRQVKKSIISLEYMDIHVESLLLHKALKNQTLTSFP